MKKLLTFCFIFLGLITVLAMQADQQPDFKFEKETNDFGKIPQGTPVTYNFKFVNVGDQPLIITNVESTCGCTVPKYTSTPIKKGETGTITVTYNAAAPGAFNKALTVKSNAKSSIKYLYIKGSVVAP